MTGYNLSYRLADLGDADIDGAPVYHLGLFPYRDPGHNVLREAWIDKSTFVPKRSVAERFVEDGPLSFRYLITVNTALIAGHLVNVEAAGHFEGAPRVDRSRRGRRALDDLRRDVPG